MASSSAHAKNLILQVRLFPGGVAAGIAQLKVEFLALMAAQSGAEGTSSLTALGANGKNFSFAPDMTTQDKTNACRIALDTLEGRRATRTQGRIC